MAMKVSEFTTNSIGVTAGEAFARAREDAVDKTNSSGYTGTIADKGAFCMVETRPRESVAAAILRFMRDPKHRDPRAPACCIDTGPAELRGHRTFVFFGMAHH